MQATRQQILDHIRQNGEATIRDLVELLSLTPTGIRQHLTVLERDNLVRVQESRGRIGRPALVYTLTQQADSLFPHRYDELSNLLLEEIRTIAGSQGLQAVLMRIATRTADSYHERLEGKTLRQRTAEATAIMNERGCISESEASGPNEFLLHQYTCPFPDVASNNSGVCALEVEFVRRLSGGDARLVSSLLRGDRSCTYRIRPTTKNSARS